LPRILPHVLCYNLFGKPGTDNPVQADVKHKKNIIGFGAELVFPARFSQNASEGYRSLMSISLVLPAFLLRCPAFYVPPRTPYRRPF